MTEFEGAGLRMGDRQLAQIVWDYMRYEQPLERVDVILGLGGPDIVTAEWCAQLFYDGWADRMLFTGNEGVGSVGKLAMPEADWFANRAMELGVPKEAILIENKATNTGQNIQFSKALLKKSGIDPRTVIVVTRPAMLRRAYATFMKQRGDGTPNIIMSAVNFDMERYCEETGHTFAFVVNWMVGDLQRIREYPKRGFQIEQDIPADVREAYEELVARGYDEHIMKEV